MKINNALYSALGSTDPFKALATVEGVAFRHLNNRITQRIQIEQHSFFVKYHRGVGWKEIFKNLVRGRFPIIDASNEYRALKRLEAKNISVPMVLGFAQKGLNPAKKTSFIVLETIEPAISLEDLMLQWQKTPPLFYDKKQLIEQVATMARGMHEAGVFHRDLYLCHFLMTADKKLTLIDFHRARCFKQLPLKYRQKDLAGLYFSALMAQLSSRDIFRFMTCYLNCSLRDIDASTWRYFKKIEQRAFKLYRKVYGFDPQKRATDIEKKLHPGCLIRFDDHSTLKVTAILRVNPTKRMVVKGCYNKQSVVAKLYFHSVKRHLHAQRELQGIEHLINAAIPTPALLAKKEAPQMTVLLYEEISAPSYRLEGIDFQHDKPILYRLIDTLVTHHHAGIVQNDLHLGNFIITDDVIFTLDGDQIQKTVTPEKIRDNLALFLAQFAQFSPANRQELVTYYLNKVKGLPEALFDNIEACTVQKITQRGREYLTKIYRDCTPFAVAQNYKSYRVIPRDRLKPSLLHALGDLDSVMSKPGMQIYKNGNTCTVAKISIDGQHYAIKRYNIKNMRHFLTRFWRPSRAWRSWYGAYLFQFFGIPTLQPVALMEQRWGKIRRQAYFVAELVEGEPLRDYFLNQNYTDEQKRAMAEKAMNLLKQLYALKIKHGDMKASNFIVKDDKIFLIDLDSVSWFRCNWWFEKSVRGDWKRFFVNWGNNPEINTLFKGL